MRPLSTSSRNVVAASLKRAVGYSPQVTVVGGGAAGLTAAFFAAENGAQVTVLERTREAGKKILMSGGSRCNVLPLDYDLQRDFFSDSSPSALRAIFASWSLDDCRDWLSDPRDGLGLELAMEEETQKWFPVSNSSREVRDRLLAACLKRGVQIRYNSSVEGIRALTSPTSHHRGGGDTCTSDQDTYRSGTAGSTSAADETQRGRSSEHSSSNISGSSSSSSNTSSSSSSSDAAAWDAMDEPAGVTHDGWSCRLADGSEHVSERLVLATGGLSFPLVGTDGTGHRILQTLGHTLVEPYAALTPLKGEHPAGQQLAGVSMYGIGLQCVPPPAAASSKGGGGRKAAKPVTSQRRDILFTHKGFSGPSVLDLSHLLIKAIQRGQQPLPELRVNWTSESAEEWDARLKAGGTAMLTTVLQRAGVRERLAAALCDDIGVDGNTRVCELRRVDRQALVKVLTAYVLRVTGHEGYKKAEVTGGGVPLSEINCATMESRRLADVYLCGEVLDVFGRIGGFNFLAAWITGRLAGLGAARIG